VVVREHIHTPREWPDLRQILMANPLKDLAASQGDNSDLFCMGVDAEGT
jgi:hypothetical protein